MACATSCAGARPADAPIVERLRAPVSPLPIARPVTGAARYVPVDLGIRDEDEFGRAEGGGLRAIVAGVRMVLLPGGAVTSAAGAPLPSAPSEAVTIPARMGGGFLLRIGATLYRADDWLAPITPIFAAPSGAMNASILRTAVGLDRVYVQLQQGAFVALDPKDGAQVELGTLPKSPYVGPLVALDGWRAAAIVDTRGLVVTEDAGATWSPVSLPIEPTTLSRFGDDVVVGGSDPGRGDAYFQVTTEGHFARLSAAPTLDEDSLELPESPKGPFGAQPLVAAIEDGWPLSDGTALVARDGALGRVRLEDGALVEVEKGAFELKPARCHGVSLAHPDAPDAFGFVCGEPRGRTVIYAFDAKLGALRAVRQFDAPREVISSGNGALVIRGGCDASAPSDDAAPSTQTYCVVDRLGGSKSVTTQGAIGGERVVSLADGRTVVLSPPVDGNITTARIYVVGKSGAPVVFEPEPAALTPDEQRDAPVLASVLRSGTWLDGFEERKPGVISGWVVGRGTAVGVEITTDGRAKHGRFVRDLGTVVVSGAYGIGWSRNQGHETIDGGMTWATVSLPEPLKSAGEAVRACGRLGCEAAGWLRVGWGEPPQAKAKVPGTVVAAYSPPRVELDLRCEVQDKPAPRVPFAFTGNSRTRDWSAFLNALAPKLGADDHGYSLESQSALGHSTYGGDANVRSVARLYAWGPQGVEWDQKGRVLARWAAPFEPSTSAHSSRLAAIPPFIANACGECRGFVAAQSSRLQAGAVAFSEDGAQALWAFRMTQKDPTSALLLESDRGPTELRFADGDPVTGVDAAVHAGGRWYIATASTDGPSAIVVWEVESGIAHELARLPRAATSNAQSSVQLARSADGRSIGVVLVGQPAASRFTTPQLYIVPITIATARTLEPEVLAAVDTTNGAVACAVGAGGWVLETPWNNRVHLDLGGGDITSSASFARIHFQAGRTCVERVALGEVGADQVHAEARAAATSSSSEVLATVLSDGLRRALRCHSRAEPTDPPR